jgi:hypothetical protein
MTGTKWGVVILAILGVLAIVSAIFYYTMQAHSLPSFLGPIHIGSPGAHAHRKRRGEAALVVGIVLLVIAAIVGFVGRSRNVSSKGAPQQV